MDVVENPAFNELYDRFEQLAAEQDEIGKIGENLSSETSNANIYLQIEYKLYLCGMTNTSVNSKRG